MNLPRYLVFLGSRLCASADLKADALHAIALYPGSYAFDTWNRKEVK